MSALAEMIAAQGELLEEVLVADLDAALSTLEPAKRIWLVGTGTSQHAAELGCWLFAPAGREVRWASSASFVLRAGELREGDAVLVVSHTAETAFSRRARQLALAAGLPTLSITGRGMGWPEAIETIPRELSETYTASYTAALAVLARLAAGLGQAAFPPDQLAALPARVGSAARSTDPGLLPPDRLAILAGTGPAAITAREGALKLREAARVAAEGYEAEYLLHGSAVPLGGDDALLVLQPEDDEFGLLGRVGIAAGREGVAVAELREPPGLAPALAQIPLTVRLQALACRWAEDRGLDPDRVIVSAWVDEDLWSAGSP